MSRCSKLLVIAVSSLTIFCAAALSMPASSEAKVIAIRSCQPMATNTSSRSGDSWTGSANAADAVIRTIEDCPTGLRFDTSKQASLGTNSNFWFALSSGLAFDSIRFKYRTTGADTGYLLSLQECAGCEPIRTFDSTAGAEVETLKIALNKPKRIYLQVKCSRPVCDPSGGLAVNSVAIEATDETPPEIQRTFMSSSWQRKSQATASFELTDPAGVGLGSSSAWIQGRGMRVWSQGPCNLIDIDAVYSLPTYYGPSGLCPASHSFSGVLPLDDLPDGTHTLVVKSNDGLGNAMEDWRKTLRIDDTPPDVPEDLRILETTEGQWIHSSRISLSWVYVGERATTELQSGLNRVTVDMKPRLATQPDPAPVQAQRIDWHRGGFELEMPEDGEWDIYVWTEDFAGNSSGKQKVTVRRDSDTPPTPKLDEVEWLTRDELLEGRELTWSRAEAPELESGICGYAVLFDGTPGVVPTDAITHRGDIDRARVPADLPAGSNWAHIRAVSCAGLLSDTAHGRIRVDPVAPTVSFQPDSSTSWKTDDGELMVSAEDAGSGIAGIEYEVSGQTKKYSTSSDLTLALPDGEIRVQARAKDVAGNWSRWSDFTTKIDRVAPTGTFLARENADPTKLLAQVEDTASGVAQADIQIRRNNDASGVWQSLPSNVEVDVLVPKRWLVSTRIPDESLPPGSYSARLVTYDVAGNRSVNDDLWFSGIPIQLTLPLRGKTSMTAKVAPLRSKCRGVRTDCVVANEIDIERARETLVEKQSTPLALVGSLVRSGGAPIANATINIEAIVTGGGRQQLGTAVTDSSGGYRFPLPNGPSRTIAVSYAGSSAELPQKNQASIEVWASSTLRARVQRVRGRRAITISGELRGKRAEYPMNEVMVILEFWTGRVWQTGIGRALVGRDGRFSVPPYALPRALSAKKRLRVRGFIRSTGTGWPYRDAYTDQATVRLR